MMQQQQQQQHQQHASHAHALVPSAGLAALICQMAGGGSAGDAHVAGHRHRPASPLADDAAAVLWHPGFVAVTIQMTSRRTRAKDQKNREGCGCPNAGRSRRCRKIADFPAARHAVCAKVWALSSKDNGCFSSETAGAFWSFLNRAISDRNIAMEGVNLQLRPILPVTPQTILKPSLWENSPSYRPH